MNVKVILPAPTSQSPCFHRRSKVLKTSGSTFKTIEGCAFQKHNLTCLKAVFFALDWVDFSRSNRTETTWPFTLLKGGKKYLLFPSRTDLEEGSGLHCSRI